MAEPPIVNIRHAHAWNGWEGDLWARNPERYDGMMGGVNDALLTAAALGSSDRVLDIGCGGRADNAAGRATGHVRVGHGYRPFGRHAGARSGCGAGASPHQR